MPTIRIDHEVYSWLQKNARAFEDSPNSVLRRIAGLNENSREPARLQSELEDGKPQASIANRYLTGRALREQWKIPAVEVRYHKDGHFFENVKRFPAAFCDPNGYVIFSSASDLRNTPKVKIGIKTNIRDGIATLPNYKRMT